MADRYPYWITDQVPGRRPTTAGVILLFATLAVLLYALLAAPWVTASSGGQRVRPPGCVEQQRLERHGATSGPSYRRAVRACQEATSPPTTW